MLTVPLVTQGLRRVEEDEKRDEMIMETVRYLQSKGQTVAVFVRDSVGEFANVTGMVAERRRARGVLTRLLGAQALKFVRAFGLRSTAFVRLSSNPGSDCYFIIYHTVYRDD